MICCWYETPKPQSLILLWICFFILSENMETDQNLRVTKCISPNFIEKWKKKGGQDTAEIRNSDKTLHCPVEWCSRAHARHVRLWERYLVMPFLWRQVLQLHSIRKSKPTELHFARILALQNSPIDLSLNHSNPLLVHSKRSRLSWKQTQQRLLLFS